MVLKGGTGNGEMRNGKRRNEIKKNRNGREKMLVTLEIFFWSIELKSIDVLYLAL